ncbi:MAG TPA: peptidase T [Candidatus Ventrimonas merdavium]|nr:peptidase T [Candidatus Ventrimonas merdavium]
MLAVAERFIRYAKIDTQSQDGVEAFPSTEKQKRLGELLVEEMKALGLSDVRMDAHGYVYGVIPSNLDGAEGHPVPSLGFIAHMDTAPACLGTGVDPQIVGQYDGGVIWLNREMGLALDPAEFEDLADYKGQDLITTDGNTLLGADDKAGVAEIMEMAAYLMAHPEIPHGKICIGFTPDEEVGRGADFFDVEGFGADVAYTVDGGALGELEYENFNAASAFVTIHGVSIHTGSARGKMKNALLLGMELHSLLPVYENPACTDGYEGFFHLDDMKGCVETCSMKYFLRDHDRAKFEKKKQLMEAATDYMNVKYGSGTVELKLQDSYYNMIEQIKPHFYLIDAAREAMKALDIQPKICAIRGGTDGARLSYMGLPCPNLCTGGHNFHGRYEYISIQSMDKIVKLLVRLAETIGEYAGK